MASKDDNPHKKSHKDIDARWVKKRGERFYVYKDNVEICNKIKLIRNYTVCAASRHDSKETEHVLTEPSKDTHGESAWLDAGYTGMEDVVRAKHLTPIICEKGLRGHPLTVEQKERNRQKSKVHSRVEYVFGFIEQTMGGLIFRGVGLIRAKANIAKVERRASLLDMPRCSNVTIGNIALTNLVYNMCRLVQIKKYHPYLITVQ